MTQPASFLQTAKAVLCAFLGIRKRDAHEADATRLRPLQVVIAGVIAAGIFVLSLALLARFIAGA